MSKSIRAIQITDCHLPKLPELEYRSINSHENLKLLLKKVQRFAIDFEADFILATGDLSEDASAESYRLLHSYLSKTGLPVLALPGNHDEPALLERFFPRSPVDNIEVSEHGQWQLIRINSCLASSPAGQISDLNLAELERVLSKDSGRSRLLAVHHQPVPVGSLWIDKYKLMEADSFLRLIDQCKDVKAVVWGHVHQVFSKDRNGTLMLSGPSSAINALPGEQKFMADPLGPACRWLELETNGGISTGIIR
jgi:Icc protein